MSDPVQTKIEFNSSIETLVSEKRIPYMEAVIMECDRLGVEIESASKLILPRIKKLIKAEATKLNMMKIHR